MPKTCPTLAALALALALALGGCVAPEEAPAPRYMPPVASQPAASPGAAQFDLAPTPNRAIGRPAADEVIRLAH